MVREWTAKPLRQVKLETLPTQHQETAFTWPITGPGLEDSSLQSLVTNTGEGYVLSLGLSAGAWNDDSDKRFSICICC